MKRVFAVDGKPVVLEVPEPTLRRNEVLVAPIFSAISVGTETGIIRGSDPATPETDVFKAVGPPRPKLRSAGVRWDGDRPRPEGPGRHHLGYGLAGRVLAVDDSVTDISVGDLVACSGDQAAHHAERVAVPRNLLAKVPEGVRPEQAAFVTLGTIATHGLRRTGCYFGETVIVYGLGLLGLLTVQIAKAAGIYTIGLDIDNRRFEQAIGYGALAALNPRESDTVGAVLAATNGFGADAVVLALYTESSEPLNHAFDLCRQRGTVVGIGAFGMNIARERMYARDITFLPSLAYGPGRYDHVYEEGGVDFAIGHVRWTENRNMEAFLRLLAEGKVEVDSLAPVHMPLTDAPAAYDLLRSPERPATVLLTYGQS
jgi:threonine dehydrogenase-like Zn-dependent dehydrogenase